MGDALSVKGRRLGMPAGVGCAVALALLLLGGAEPASAGYKWYVHTPITDPVVTSSTAPYTGIGIEGQVTFTCSECFDFDKLVQDGQTSRPEDIVTYNWSADGGSFLTATDQRTVTWKAPSSPGYKTIKVIVNDRDSRGGSGHGSDNDPQKAFEYKMHVIRLDQIRLVYYNYHTGYPYRDDPIKLRAIVWFSCTGSAGPHCDLPFNMSLEWWWMAGSEGPQADSVPPPVTPMFTQYVADWPNFLPPLTIEWKWLKHKGSDLQAEGDYDRKYSYEESVYLTNAWGYDNYTFADPGVHRLRATARLHPGTAWQQSVTSLDKEYALRICTKDPTIYVEPSPPPANSAQRRSYLEWLSTYQGEPYEWGGEGFGGRDSSGQWVGGDDSYEGYGIDCSGLVSCGACRAGYKWYQASGGWRHVTLSIPSVTTAVTTPWKNNLVAGDVINMPRHHVISYKKTEGEAPNRVFLVIEAYGTENYTPKNIVWQRTRTESYLSAPCTTHSPAHSYEGRVLTQYTGCEGGLSCLQ